MSVDSVFEKMLNSLNDESLSWIRRSSITERAFLIGLFKGLNEIAGEDTISSQLIKPFAETVFSRDSDDSFNSTQIGKNYTSLEIEFQKIESGKDIDLSVINTIVGCIRRLDGGWQQSIKEAQYLLAEINSLGVDFYLANRENLLENNAKKMQDEIESRIRKLREILRYIALLETHHEMWKRFEL